MQRKRDLFISKMFFEKLLMDEEFKYYWPDVILEALRFIFSFFTDPV